MMMKYHCRNFRVQHKRLFSTRSNIYDGDLMAVVINSFCKKASSELYKNTSMAT